MLSVCFSSQAQSTRSIFKADRRVSAANYLAYPGPQKRPFTPAPKGYVPFYLSHYGRHGSRWLIGERDYQRPVVWLMQADSLGKLTPKGKEVLQKLRIIRDAAAGRDGELTLLGAQQHQQIAERMMKNFPEIFAGKTHIDAKSTTIIRCILSMENALQQLVRRNPQLVISHDASNHDMYYMNHDDTTLFKKRFTVAAKQAYLDFKKQHEQPARVMNELFNDTQYWKNHVDTLALYETLFRQAGDLQSTELRHTMSLYALFTALQSLASAKRLLVHCLRTFAPQRRTSALVAAVPAAQNHCRSRQLYPLSTSRSNATLWPRHHGDAAFLPHEPRQLGHARRQSRRA